MKKLLKIIAVLVGLVVVFLILGSVALRIYLPPEKAKALVLQRLSTQLKREVKLGSVSVGILSGLQMTDLKISESPDFSRGTFLSSERFSLKVGLLPLLFRKMVVRQILLQRPQVTITRNADGKTFNFSDLTGPGASPAAPARPAETGTSKESLPFLLLISRAEIQKGALHFIDHSPARQSMDVEPFDFRLSNVSLTSPFSVQTAFGVKAKGKDLAISLSGQANLLSGTFTIKQGSLACGETKVTLSGDLSRLKTGDPAVDIHVEIPKLSLPDVSPFVSMPPGIKIDKPLKGSVSIKGDQKDVAVQSQVALGSLRVEANGHLKDLAGRPAFNFHVGTNAFPLEELLAYAPSLVPAGLVLKGANELSADVTGTLTACQFSAKWVGTGLQAAQGDLFSKPAGMPLELSLSGEAASLEPLKVLIKSLTLQLASNRLTGSGTYEVRGAAADVNFAAQADQWSVAELAKVSPLAAPYHPTGTLSLDLRATGPVNALQTSVRTKADVAAAQVKQDYYEGRDLKLTWNLSDVTPDLSKVNGTASLRQGPGKILNVEKLAAGSKIGKMVLAPLEVLDKLQKKGLLSAANVPSLQAVTFDSIVGDYDFKAGVMTIKVFDLSGKDLSIQNRGTLGLAGVQPINLSVVMKMAAGSVSGTLGQLVNDENGRPTLKFAATGTVSDPKVKLDVQDVGKKALEQAGQELLKNKDVQDAVGNLQNSLKGLFH